MCLGTQKFFYGINKKKMKSTDLDSKENTLVYVIKIFREEVCPITQDHLQRSNCILSLSVSQNISFLAQGLPAMTLLPHSHPAR